MSGPTVDGATGPNGLRVVIAAGSLWSNIGHASSHYGRNAEDAPVSVREPIPALAVSRAATVGARETDTVNVQRASLGRAARQVSTIIIDNGTMAFLSSVCQNVTRRNCKYKCARYFVRVASRGLMHRLRNTLDAQHRSSIWSPMGPWRCEYTG